MATVRQMLEGKGHDIWSVRPGEKVFDAIKTMAEMNVGAVIVMEDNKPVGIFTERDYARNVILKGKASPETPVSDVMTTRLICAHLDQTVEECMAVMTENHIRHLPVIDDDRLVGILSIGDLVKSIIADQKFAIEQLEHFIRS